jgi:hydantoinase/carbamoylase family amidase
MQFGDRILEQADCLAGFSESELGITRTFLSRSHEKAAQYLLELMRRAGMACEIDALGNVVGRYAGSSADAPTILCGSHQDSVVDAGRYDGLFGILSPIACVAELHRQGRRLSHAIEVVAFGDEEGVRFDVTMIGSAAMAGSFDPVWLERRDSAGISMREALDSFGGNPDRWAEVRRDPKQLTCFVETHIEQGPVLLEKALPVGVVSAIAGVSRSRIAVIGVAGHAGTVPMPLRRDAYAAAAEMALAIEAVALERADHLVATVGKVAVAAGGAINVIPGKVEFTLDLRSGDDARRLDALAEARRRCEAIALRRHCELQWQDFFQLSAAPCDRGLQERLAAAIARRGIEVRYLPSGAGHDAMKFDGVVPIAMLFVRCGNGGISHNPAEIMTAEDAEIGTAVLLDFFESFGA